MARCAWVSRVSRAPEKPPAIPASSAPRDEASHERARKSQPRAVSSVDSSRTKFRIRSRLEVKNESGKARIAAPIRCSEYASVFVAG